MTSTCDLPSSAAAPAGAETPQTLFLAERLEEAEQAARWAVVARLDQHAGHYCFRYTRGVEKLEGFTPLAEFPDVEVAACSRELFPLFRNRLLNRRRKEYTRALAWSGFSVDDPPDDLQLLAITEGRRVTDQLELFAPPQPVRGESVFRSRFFVHGVRHLDDSVREQLLRLSPGTPAKLRREDENPADSHAVAVDTVLPDCDEPTPIGYVPRYLAREVRRGWEQPGLADPQLRVVQVNPDAPQQQRVLAELTYALPTGEQPFASDRFQGRVRLPDPIDETAA